jgi:hypothetical protein
MRRPHQLHGRRGQVADNTSSCNADEFLVRTYRFGASPISPTLSNQVAFYLLVP